MTSIRTTEGINLSYVTQHFGEEKTLAIMHESDNFVKTDRLIVTSDAIKLTTTGKLFADGISADLFFE
jgi:oxygen-independent coproporphyrinogen-3 oxidase